MTATPDLLTRHAAEMESLTLELATLKVHHLQCTWLHVTPTTSHMLPELAGGG